jgi:hypothetical protein
MKHALRHIIFTHLLCSAFINCMEQQKLPAHPPILKEKISVDQTTAFFYEQRIKRKHLVGYAQLAEHDPEVKNVFRSCKFDDKLLLRQRGLINKKQGEYVIETDMSLYDLNRNIASTIRIEKKVPLLKFIGLMVLCDQTISQSKNGVFELCEDGEELLEKKIGHYES